MAKSAQSLHSWLPGIWKSYTSIQALIHAATLVTADYILLVRSFSFIEYSSTALLIITLVGVLLLSLQLLVISSNDLKRL